MARVLHKCEQCGECTLGGDQGERRRGNSGDCSGCGRSVMGAYVPSTETVKEPEDKSSMT